MFDPAAYLTDAGVDSVVIADWLQLRKEKRAPVTLATLINIESEARMAAITLEDALGTACAWGWRGFKAEWVK